MSKAISFFGDRERIEVHAVFVGRRLNMKALEQSQKLASSPLMIRAGTDGCAVLFRYGAVAMFGLNAMEEAAFLQNLEDFVIDPFDKPESERCELQIDEKAKQNSVEQDYILLTKADIETLQLVATILAKSAVLSYYEQQVAGVFEKIDPVVSDLQVGKSVSGRRSRELLRHIGYTLSIQRLMVGHVEIEEKPEVLWDFPQLERFYIRLEDEYEISERHSALRNKLDLINQTAKTLMGLLTEKRTLHVEWYIVILIVIEILLTLGEKIFGI